MFTNKYPETPTSGLGKKETSAVSVVFLSLYPLVAIVNHDCCNAKEDRLNFFSSQFSKVLTSDYCISVFHLFQAFLEQASSILLA